MKRLSLRALAIVVSVCAGWSLPADHAWSQTAEFIQHKERLHRLTRWAHDNPQLDAGVNELIVRREKLPEGSDDTVVTRIVFYNRVFFDFDKARLTKKGHEVIETIAGMLTAEVTPPAVLIAGHTDSTGPESYNFLLSSRRARTVAYRFADFDVPVESMHVIAMGEIQPISSSRTKNGRAVNRRIEIFFSATQAANEIAAIQVPFDPCHRNDHPGASAAERCEAGRQTVTVEALAGKGRLKSTDREIDLGR